VKKVLSKVAVNTNLLVKLNQTRKASVEISLTTIATLFPPVTLNFNP